MAFLKLMNNYSIIMMGAFFCQKIQCKHLGTVRIVQRGSLPLVSKVKIAYRLRINYKNTFWSASLLDPILFLDKP
jgi:hypothetical protein